MPPTIKVSRADILNVAIEIVRVKGWECINAREIAKNLECSTRPIFREFENMAELKTVLHKHACESHNKMLSSYKSSDDKLGLNVGVAYVKFAKEEKNLFKLIFMSNEIFVSGAGDLSSTLEDEQGIIDNFMKINGLDREKATKLYFNVWLVMHGLATMLATNSLEMSEKEIGKIILNNYNGYLKILQE